MAACTSDPPGLPGTFLFLARTELEDPRYLVALDEVFSFRPIWIAPDRNMWCDVLTARRPGSARPHIHARPAFAYTLSGRWGYAERDWTAAPGDFVCEPAGMRHTLVAHAGDAPLRVLFVVQGPLVWLDDDGNPDGYFDVHQYVARCAAHFERVGLGEARVRALMR